MDLSGKRILITGVGAKFLACVFKNSTGKSTHTPIFYNGQEYKANLGAAIALECLKLRAIVHLVCHTKQKAIIIKQWLEENVHGAVVEYSVLDINNKVELEQSIQSIPTDLPLYWVQSLLSLGSNNPYLPLEQLTPEIIRAEALNLTCAMRLLQILLPRFKQQVESKIVIITTMSSIRGYPFGLAYISTRGGLSRFINAARMELDKNNIYITEIRPGMIDTGWFDSEAVKEANLQLNKNFCKTETLSIMPPTAVGKMVALALCSEAALLSINMVAKGQEVTERS
jgi:short-subunit dehydrogenase